MTKPYRIWDNNFLTLTYEQCAQIMSKVEEKCSESVNPEDLPMSMITTANLYDIASAYIDMYDKLTKAQLIQAGYISKTNSVTH